MTDRCEASRLPGPAAACAVSYQFDAMFAPRSLLPLLLSLALVLGTTLALPQGRLLGSEDAKVAEFPWAGSLRLDHAHVCGVTIISTTQLLTAAHCVSDLGTTP